MLKMQQSGGGGGRDVFIMLIDDIEIVEGAVDELQTDNEIVWTQLKLQ